jgi:hypothetical protein
MRTKAAISNFSGKIFHSVSCQDTMDRYTAFTRYSPSELKMIAIA